jgi:hypothetical protein
VPFQAKAWTPNNTIAEPIAKDSGRHGTGLIWPGGWAQIPNP